MSADSRPRLPRRAIIAASLGAVATAAAQRLAAPAAVLAGSDGDIVLGATNTAASTTRVTSTATDGTAIEARADAIAVEGRTAEGVGLAGVSGLPVDDSYPGPVDASTGVYGLSLTGAGVYGASNTGPGVYGATHGDGVAAVGGQGNDGTGVHGFAGDWQQRSTALPSTGVYGSATGDGTGVAAQSDSGVALAARTPDPLTGTALRASGRVRFDHCAGVAVVRDGRRTVTVVPGIQLVAASAVVATLQGSAGGTTTVHRVDVDAAGNQFTIHLTAIATRDARVAWHVFG